MREPSNKHEYELEPRKGDQRGPMLRGAARLDARAAELAARQKAEALLAEHPDWTSIGVYHTYPDAGPVRRFVREVKRPVPVA